MSWAVRVAVPDGASTLFGWWSSTTSTDSKYGAAICANFMVRTAPMEKFGAMSTPVSGDWASHPFSFARRSSVQPVVPTTAWMPCRTQKSRLSMTEAGCGQLHGDLGAGLGERLQLVAPAEGGDQLHVLGGLDRPYRLGTDPALGTEDRHAQLAHLLASLPVFRRVFSVGGWR